MLRVEGKEVMRRPYLTKKYPSIFEKRAVKEVPYLFLDVLLLVHDAYKSRKLSELISFMIWELFHKLGLFPKREYLEFNNNEPLTLENERSNASDFSENIDNFFRSRRPSIVRSYHNWKMLFINNNEEIFGCLYSEDKNLYKSSDNGKSIALIKEFPKSIVSIFISSQNTIFVCVKGTVYRSLDSDGSFKKSLDLSSSESYFRFNYGMTETPNKTLIIGEYGNVWNQRGWRNLAYLYFSSDDGESWESSDFLIKKGANKHVHMVWYSKLLNKIVVTDGDNKKRLWVSDSLNPFDLKKLKWKLINKFHIQMGGYVSTTESDEKILFGTDYLGGTNFLVESRDCQKFSKKILPDPYRKSPIMKLVQRKSKKGNEIWALLPYSTSSTKSLLMYSLNCDKSWSKVIEYSSTSHGFQVISSSKEIADVLYFSVRDKKNNNRIVYKILDY